MVIVFPNIEKIKQEYTDKYVVVDAKRPELARFADVVGQVKTVNMSGRALVEFLDYHLNIGWFDIELEFLKVVDKPQPKPKEEKKAAAKPQAEKSAEAKTAPSKAAAPAGKPSTADILAKLKGGAGAGPGKAPAPEKSAAAGEPKAPSTPPAKSASSAPAKIDRSKMSVADMLAAARGGAAATPKAEAAAPVQEAAAPGPSIPEPAAPPHPAAEAASPAPASKSEGGIVKIDKSGMSIEQMLAYCREKDAK